MSELDKIIFGIAIIAAVILGVVATEHARASAERCDRAGGTYRVGQCFAPGAVLSVD